MSTVYRVMLKKGKKFSQVPADSDALEFEEAKELAASERARLSAGRDTKTEVIVVSINYSEEFP